MKIVFLNGTDVGKIVDLTTSGLTIGRETDNHLQLPVGGVSRYHARIDFFEGAYMLRDLGSTNGTKLNGMVIQKVEALKNEDIIAIGEQQFRVEDPDSANGKPDSKIGSATVKIPANVPVPEPAVPQFVFRPDSGSQPPSSPPVADCSETATVNIAPEISEIGGNDFFAKRDGDGNLFKKEDEKKSGGKSTLRGNLIFALIILLMIGCGVLLFMALNPDKKDKKGKGGRKNGSEMTEQTSEADEFFFYYEIQSVDEKNEELMKKRVFCRRVGDTYKISMCYDNAPVQVFETESLAPEPKIRRQRENASIVNFAKENRIVTPEIGNNMEWTRLVIGAGGDVSDVLAIGNAKSRSFIIAENAINRFLQQTNGGRRMLSPKDLIREAEIAWREANNHYRDRERRPVAAFEAMSRYLDVVDTYKALRSDNYRDKMDAAASRASELEKELNKIYDDALNMADIAMEQKNYREALKHCQRGKAYFPEGTTQHQELKSKEMECNRELSKQQKGK